MNEAPAAGSTPGGPAQRQVRLTLGFAAILCCAVAYFGSLWNCGYVMGDEGIHLLNGWRIVSGEVPHRDFFEITPPASFLPVALFYRLFGMGLFAARLLTILYAVALVLSAERLLARYHAALLPRAHLMVFLVPYGVFAWRMPSHHWVADIAQLLATIALHKGLAAARPLWKGLWAGTWTAIAGLSLQDQGVVFAVALAAGFFPWISDRTRRRSLFLGWLVATATPALALAAYLAVAGGLAEFVRQAVLFPVTQYHEIPGNAPSLARAWSGLASAGWSDLAGPRSLGWLIAQGLVNVLPLAAVAVLVAAYARRWAARAEVGLLAALVLSALAAAVRRYDLINLVWAAPPMLLVVSWGLARLVGSPRAAVRVGVAVAFVGFIGIWFVGAAGEVYLARFSSAATTFETPAGRLCAVGTRKTMVLKELVEGVVANVPPGAPLVVIGYAPLLNVLTKHPNPTRFNYFAYPQYHTEAQAREFVAALIARPDAYVLMRHPPPLDQAWLVSALVDRYRVVWEGPEVVLLVQVSPNAPASRSAGSR